MSFGRLNPSVEGMMIVPYWFYEATMFEFHEKRKLKKILFSRGMLLLLFVLTACMVYGAHNAYKKKEVASARREELAAELAALEHRASELEGDIEELEDSRGIEAELRSRYEVGKEGEEMIVLVEEKAPPAPKEELVKQEKGFWDRMLEAIF